MDGRCDVLSAGRSGGKERLQKDWGSAGGLKRIAAVTEKIVPFMVFIYMIGSIAMLVIHFDKAGMIFTAIFRGAFGFKSVAGGIVGSGIRQAMVMGMKRGVFSNEAGLGSSVMVHSSSNVKEPVQQGMWGIFEVFADTLNGLMAVPNLIGVLVLSGTVAAITKNYINRTFKNSEETPMLSAFPDIQREQMKGLGKD